MKKFLKTCGGIFLLVFFLVLLDQGAKLAIDRFYTYDADALMQVKNTVHLHPKVNFETPNQLADKAEHSGIPLLFWKIADVAVLGFLAVSLIGLIWFLSKILSKITVLTGAKPPTRFSRALVGLAAAAAVSGECDRLFWDGTHDFLCVSRTYFDDRGKEMILHEVRDLKDCYLDLLVVLLAVFLLLTVWKILKLSKDKDAFREFEKSLKELLKHPFCKKIERR